MSKCHRCNESEHNRERPCKRDGCDITIPAAAVEAAARALDANFNPDHYPIMAAMFRDYARTALAAAAPHIAAQVASDIHGQFGVNVSDEMSDWWDGYRQAQRDVLRKLREIEAYYRIEADHG